ncbi:MAG: CRISPR-associated protein Cas4 [Clostridiales bacterium]|nr:CRISPR-associated protein Cas4 [Clostridiales bacterium]MDY3748092.1 CRISPR-associated protein Cas4 [Lachnospiraceae bacterium]
MNINGTLVNYYFHCKRQCYLFGNRLNLEDNSEDVQIGKAIHEEKAEEKNTEIAIENIRLDKLTSEYITEVKKSDADVNAAKWQLIFYIKVLKDKGIIRKGRLEFKEKNNKTNKTEIIEMTDELERELEMYVYNIEELLEQEEIPPVIHSSKCKKCAYYEYCYI